MRSHLTRNVYCRLLLSPALLQPCPAAPRRTMSTCRRRSPVLPGPLVRRSQRRTLSLRSLWKAPPRDVKESAIEPGYTTMLLLQSHLEDQVRIPSWDKVWQGFLDFTEYKQKTRKPLNSSQALVVLHTLEHLLYHRPPGAHHKLASTLISRGFEVVLLRPPGPAEEHIALATYLYEVVSPLPSTNAVPNGCESKHFKQYITALARFGRAQAAGAKLVELSEDSCNPSRVVPKAGPIESMWHAVLDGLAREGNEKELLEKFDMAWKRKLMRYTPDLHEAMTCFFAARDRVNETKYWFEFDGLPVKLEPTPGVMRHLCRFAVRLGQQEWMKWTLARMIRERTLEKRRLKETHNAVLYWLALTADKGVDEIQNMIQAEQRKTPNEREFDPDSGTLNQLMQAAIDKKDPYMAERFINMGMQVGLQPDRKTYLLQMENRMAAHDLKGTWAIYELLRDWSFTSDGSSTGDDIPILNKYIRMMCAAPKSDMEHVMDVTSTLEQRREVLEPSTVINLVLFFLRNDKPYEVIDTLALHTVLYSYEEREAVYQAMVDFCLDGKNSTARVWDVYSLVRQFFPEMDNPRRVQMMEAFFGRKRPDMAVHVFGHMRARPEMALHPTVDHYVLCFERLGRYPDPTGTKVVHNMLKMDSTIQMTTRIYNALMIAYVGCDMPSTALNFWKDITAQKQGPSYNSLEVVFRACELEPFGDRQARPIWERLQRMDAEVPPRVFDAYLGALAASGCLEEVKRMILAMSANMGYPPSVATLIIVFNALHGEARKETFQKWAAKEFPELWARVKMRRWVQTAEKGEQISHDRFLEA